MFKNWLYRLYAIKQLRWLVLKIVRRTEGGEFRSPTLRRIFRDYWGVDIGMYTHGACFRPWTVDAHTTIGRYCSIADGARILNHNHPLHLRSTSGLFFNPALGLCDDWLIQFNPLEIGNDVWIGANAVVLPEVNRIGNGAVIGAGAVVSRDVPDYAVILGNPGRVIKYRFSEETIKRLLAEQWWTKDLDELSTDLGAFQTPIEDPS